MLIFPIPVEDVAEMSVDASTLNPDALGKEDEDFSYAKSGVDEKLEQEIKDANKRKLEKADKVSGNKDAREQRMTINAEMAKYFVGECNLLIKHLTPPTETSAYRSFDENHAQHCAMEMETVGKNYPHKPALICAFKVRMFLK